MPEDIYGANTLESNYGTRGEMNSLRATHTNPGMPPRIDLKSKILAQQAAADRVFEATPS